VTPAPSMTIEAPCVLDLRGTTLDLTRHVAVMAIVMEGAGVTE
jgi:hypothetical protein